MKNIKILGKLKEALVSVLPVTLLILLFNFIFDPMETGDLINFLVGAALLIVGMSLYTLGSETSIEPVGGMIGSVLGFVMNKYKMSRYERGSHG